MSGQVQEKQTLQALVDGKRMAYVAVEAFRMREWMIAICVERDEGYRPILDYGSGKEERMKALALELNRGIGLTDDIEIAKIVASTMGFNKRGRKRR